MRKRSKRYCGKVTVVTASMEEWLPAASQSVHWPLWQHANWLMEVFAHEDTGKTHIVIHVHLLQELVGHHLQGILWPCLANNTTQRVFTLHWYNTFTWLNHFTEEEVKRKISCPQNIKGNYTPLQLHIWYHTGAIYIWQQVGTDTNKHTHTTI